MDDMTGLWNRKAALAFSLGRGSQAGLDADQFKGPLNALADQIGGPGIFLSDPREGSEIGV